VIELLEGVPGSGKSYFAVSERLLPWVRSHRKIYVYVDGIYLDKLAAFEGRTVEELHKQLVLWETADEVRSGLLTVDAGAAVLIDEAQTIFRSKEKIDPDLLRWLETHRHRGNDVVLMVQQYGQLTVGVTRLVEVTTKFRRLDRFGLKNRYQAQVRGNPEETEVIRMFSGKYSPSVYQYYASYSHAAIRESKRGATIMRSPTIVLALVGLAVSVYWFSSGRWVTPPHTATATPSTTQVPAPPVTAVSAQKEPAATVVHPVRIHGGIESRDGHPMWLWVAADGRILTEEEIAVESGGTVNGYMMRGVRRLTGSGVIYGGTEQEGMPARGASVFAENLPRYTQEMPKAEETTVVDSGASNDLLATPPSLR
jgi:zona occludens toxin